MDFDSRKKGSKNKKIILYSHSYLFGVNELVLFFYGRSNGAIINIRTVAIALFAAFRLFQIKVSTIWLVVAAALLGSLLASFSLPKCVIFAKHKLLLD